MKGKFMKQRRDDKWVDYAFDELTEEERLELEKELEADPDLLEEIKELESLKEDLQLLRDVPKCQLSVEHMRNAVLQQATPKRTKPTWKKFFLAMPVFTVCLAIGMMVLPKWVQENGVFVTKSNQPQNSQYASLESTELESQSQGRLKGVSSRHSSFATIQANYHESSNDKGINIHARPSAPVKSIVVIYDDMNEATGANEAEEIDAHSLVLIRS